MILEPRAIFIKYCFDPVWAEVIYFVRGSKMYNDVGLGQT